MAECLLRVETLVPSLARVAAADALADAELVLASHACARTRRLEVRYAVAPATSAA